MADFSLFHQVIHERMTNPNARYYADPWWEEEIKQFSVNMSESIDFVLHECTDEELYWLGEIYDDIMEKTHSAAFVEALRERVTHVDNPEWKASILEDIRTASEYIEEA